MDKKDFILASSSPQRLALLEQVDMHPKMVCPADIDESIIRFETPSHYVKRVALAKARRVATLHPGENILSCDTVVVVGRTILQKADSDERQTEIMHLISGHANHVLSAVCLIDKNGREITKCVESRVITKRFSEKEIADYVASHEWVGCSGYKIEGKFAYFVRQIVGSYSGIVGLPLYETKNLLNGVGIK